MNSTRRRDAGARSVVRVVLAVTTATAVFAGVTAAWVGAQTATTVYPGTVPPPSPGGTLRLSVNIRVAQANQIARVQACGAAPGAPLSITFVRGSIQSGSPCPGAEDGGTAAGPAGGSSRQLFKLAGVGTDLVQAADLVAQTATTLPRCDFSSPTPAAPRRADQSPEVIGNATADSQGCIDVTVRVPDAPPGTYNICGTTPGPGTIIGTEALGRTNTACDVITLTGSAARGGGFARTGAGILTLVAAGIVAILLGRTLLMPSRRRRRASAR